MTLARTIRYTTSTTRLSDSLSRRFFVFAAQGVKKQFSQSVCSVPNDVKRDSRTLDDGKKDGAEDYGDDDGDSRGASLGSGKSAVAAIITAWLVSSLLL